MSVSRTEAADALARIGEAGGRMSRLTNYAQHAPGFILWGAVWLVANAITDLAPQWATAGWIGGMAVGMAGTAILSVREARRWDKAITRDGQADKAAGLRAAATCLTIFAFFGSIFLIFEPHQFKQLNVFSAVVWQFAYMFAGVWFGWRLFALGAVGVAATMGCYLLVDQHYYLWTGIVAGGSLIAGGLLLRRV